MSDKELELKIDRLIIHSGLKKSKEMSCSVIKIIKMRYKYITKEQAVRVTKSLLN